MKVARMKRCRMNAYQRDRVESIILKGDDCVPGGRGIVDGLDGHRDRERRDDFLDDGYERGRALKVDDFPALVLRGRADLD